MDNKENNQKRRLFSGNYHFNGDKLKLAREFHCMTVSELSQDLGVSHQMVSSYEKGDKIPTEERLKKIIEILKFPRTFFFTPIFVEGTKTSPSFFRKGAAVPKKYQIQVEANTKIFSGIRHYIASKINLPKYTMPSHNLTQKEFRQIDFSEIQEIAEKTRESLGLKHGPISNITLLCEKLGIGVFFADLDSTKIDAHTVFIDSTPYIILNKARTSSVRLRFNIAHELGHILLHSKYGESETSSTSKHKRIEDEANYFAGCFLMPEEGISLDMAASNLNYLISLKQHWKVSIQAIIFRAEQLGLFSSSHVLHLRQQISRNKWRLFEPLDDEIEIEKPKLMSLGIEYILKNNICTLDEIELDTGLPLNMIEEICPGLNLERQKIISPVNNVISLF
ncbi:ImmA/IrrE family metallo-endopeptidase [Metabacillus litoralis]|uniref:ImmA/IrrE family metallo-endopeptidase n=1 Tax=Metabacillus litoralis TaxID=152268 RepID=UPI00203A620B|nr:XRE family transcriptional regulator [Metabacillus litoralis]MCM3651344.1 XRE family transcriptional regulator [Metabacillus litoralis]